MVFSRINAFIFVETPVGWEKAPVDGRRRKLHPAPGAGTPFPAQGCRQDSGQGRPPGLPDLLADPLPDAGAAWAATLHTGQLSGL